MLENKRCNRFKAILLITLMAFGSSSHAKVVEPDADNLWVKIQTGKYAEVEQTLLAAYERYKKDSKYEDDLFSIYEFTDDLSVSDEPTLLKWVSSSTKSFNANLVLGLYYRHIGWKARGGRYISKTPEANRVSMREYYDKAVLSLQKAMTINKAHPVPYRDMMRINFDLGQRDAGYTYLLQGLKYNEGSFRLRRTYVNYLQPKWGGSQAEFDKFSRDVDALSERYVALKKLAPLYYWYLADYYDAEKDFDLAIKYYTKSAELDNSCHARNDLAWLYQRIDQHKNAIKHTDITLSSCKDEDDLIIEALRIRARAKYDLGEKKEAFENFSQALEKGPDNPITLGSRGGIYYKDKQYEKALKDLDRAISYGEPKIWMLTTRAKTYKKLNRPNEAIQDYTAVIKLNPDNASYHEKRGKLYIKLELFNEAKNDIETVLKLQPDNKWALRYADWAKKLP